MYVLGVYSMAVTLQQIFGANVTLIDGVVAFDLSDLAIAGLNGATPTPSQIFAGLLSFAEGTLVDFDDPTAGVAKNQYGSTDSIVSRGTDGNGNPIYQISHPVQFNFFLTYGADFDPDDVIA